MPRRKVIRRPKTKLDEMKPVILRIAKKYGATNVRVFGSFARGEAGRRSDIDLLVDLPKEASLFTIAGLKVDLEERLHRNVDVLTPGGISKYLRKEILSTARPL